jgi:hypothetical protein
MRSLRRRSAALAFSRSGPEMQPTGGRRAACRAPARAPRMQGAAGRPGEARPLQGKARAESPCGSLSRPGLGVRSPGPEKSRLRDRLFSPLLTPTGHFQGMGQVCAWCQDEIGAKSGRYVRSTAQVSHGMCRPCLDARIAALSAIGSLVHEPDRGRAPRQRVLEGAPFAPA